MQVISKNHFKKIVFFFVQSDCLQITDTICIQPFFHLFVLQTALCKLRIIKLCIKTLLFHQLVMIPLLNNISVFHNED